MKVVEFFYFYLMPETPSGAFGSVGSAIGETGVRGGNRGGLQRSPSKRAGGGAERGGTKTTEEKQVLLGRYLNNVEDLVEDLRENAPFGTGVI